jgi:DNA-binding MarR family transcriptional regulator
MGIRLADARGLANAMERLTLWLRHESPTLASASTITALDRLHSGPLRVSELARLEAMTQPGVTLLVNRLAESGFAERVPDPTDGRATLVRITTDGEALLLERQAGRAAILRERISQLADEDQQLLSAALPAIERLLATTRDQRKP